MVTVLEIGKKAEKAEEDRAKIISLKKFILKAANLGNRLLKLDSMDSEINHVVSLKDLDVTPYTIFLNPPNFSLAPFYTVNNIVLFFSFDS